MWILRCAMVVAALTGGAAAAQSDPASYLNLLTPANLASLEHYPVARLNAVQIARQTGNGVGVLDGALLPVTGLALTGLHKCRAVYFSAGGVITGDTKRCTLTPDPSGAVLTVPGLFTGHLAPAEQQRLLFYGVRLNEGSLFVPRYGFAPSRDVAGFLYALADGRWRVEIGVEPGRFEVIELVGRETK